MHSLAHAIVNPASSADPPGNRLARAFGLQVVDLLREDRTTRTWSARTWDGRAVALVAMRPEASPRDRQRFADTAEDRCAAGDALPRVLRIHQVAPGLDGMVTDLWAMGTLRDIHTLHWSLSRRMNHGLMAIQALASMHVLGMVHGALTHDAVLLDDALEPVLGELGTVSRDEPFAAPEVRRGEAPTPQSDVFSAGRLLAHLLDGETSPAFDDVIARSMSPLAQPIKSGTPKFMISASGR